MKQIVKDIRKTGIVIRKRFSLFKYNMQMKRQVGIYDPDIESQMLNQGVRSMNLFDFSNGKMADYYLLDDYSDASEFGGETESGFGLCEDEENPRVQTCKIKEGKVVISEVARQNDQREEQSGAIRLHVLWIQVCLFVSEQLHVLQWP